MCSAQASRPASAARGLKRLIDLTGRPIGEAAAKCGVSSATATRWLAILDLPQAIQDRIDAGDIPESAATCSTRVADPATQEAVAVQIAEGELTRDSFDALVGPQAGKTASSASARRAARDGNPRRWRECDPDGRSADLVRVH